MYDVIIPDWYRFFTASIKQAITKHNSEHLLSACNVFFLTVASNARGRLCRIGEDLVQPVIQVWDRSSPLLKDQILTFLHIQVRLHHPCGAVSEADGAWASNDAHWRNCIEKMNSFIIKELDLASKRSRSTSKGEATVSPSFINFTVDVMQQAYSHTDTSFTDTSLPPKVKRSRVDSGWSILKDSLSSSSSVLIWLQLIGHLFAKESVKFPTTEIIPLISELYNILIQLKKPDARVFTVLHWVFIALKSIASYTSNNGIVYNNWKDIWTGTIKALQYRIAEDTGYELLSTLLVLKFIKTVEVDAWKIICLTTPSKSVISFIRSLLAHHKIPESLTISLPHTINEDSPLPLLSLSSSSSSYQYRITLLNHICSILDIKKPLNGSRSSVLLPVYELSTVLVSLMQQSCSLSLTLSSTSNRLLGILCLCLSST
ncbi:PREDICTED: serine-protein kinase ATM-like [Amphimedon queenslandica]|uniref:Telomere-length maintenance and DNA damage repair domain-containing protein n=1 Tax=Amphimedon queenslandica TaxID=400682 RepID=A0AAN0JHT6_AMPQE|nr:PREDICTED: serine-protein kinase ATM-like [Amphimedon queenslandica]|eukprot:XP_019856361.1 PREDICTED: serine-protein kinase ATM-like [Amphimedon queenslandica]